MGETSGVVVTGAAGNLGSHLVPELVREGFDVKSLDVVEPASPPPNGSSFCRVDLTDPDAVRATIKGADFVVHCASIFPREAYTEHQYLDNNIKGTWTLYSAAAEFGIDRIVLTSSVNAVGNVNIPYTAWPVSEDGQFSFGAIYCLTKHVQEDIARFFADAGRIRTLALRPSTFMPADEMTLGFGLLNGRFAVVGDMAAAHVAAARVMSGRQKPGEPLDAFEAFNTTYQPPYTREDAEQLGPDANTAALVKKYWPDKYDWLVEHGFEGKELPVVYDNSKAKRVLGWEVQYTFERWFAEHATC